MQFIFGVGGFFLHRFFIMIIVNIVVNMKNALNVAESIIPLS